jgi:hypothetical protein
MHIDKLTRVGLLALVVFAASLLFTCAPAWAAGVPVIVVESVSGVTPLDGVLEGQVDTEKQETSYYYEYSSEKAKVEDGEGTSLGAGSLLGTSEPQTTSPADIGGGLAPNTAYYYRLVATNGTGTSNGAVQVFRTEALQVPAIQEESVLSLQQGAVALSALIDPEFQPATCKAFQYADEAAYEPGLYTSEAPCELTELGSGPQSTTTSATLTDLEPNTVYHYRAVAENATGLGAGPDQTFLTLPLPPLVSTGEAFALTTHSATITGTVNPDNTGHSEQDDTEYYFQYGQDASYGKRTFPEAEAVGEGTSTLQETATLDGLVPGHAYHYRIVASNDNNVTPQVVYGQDETFTTAGSTPPPLTGGPETITETAVTAPSVAAFPDLTKITPVPEVKEPSEAKPKARSLTRTQKLARALKACAKKPKRARGSCERNARKHYAPPKRAITRSHR